MVRPRIEQPIEVFLKPKSNLLKWLYDSFPSVRKLSYHIPYQIRELLFDYILYNSPRIVEIPFLFRNLNTDYNYKILDTGCCFSALPIQLASMGYKVWGVDCNEYPFTHPNFTFIKSNICKMPFDDNYFDITTSISVIEHIGLGYYGDPIQSTTDIDAIKESYRVLKPGGLLYLTTHYGKEFQNNCLRTYNDNSLKILLGDFKIQNVQYYIKEKGYWYRSSKEETEKSYIDDKKEPVGLILLIAKK